MPAQRRSDSLEFAAVLSQPFEAFAPSSAEEEPRTDPLERRPNAGAHAR